MAATSFAFLGASELVEVTKRIMIDERTRSSNTWKPLLLLSPYYISCWFAAVGSIGLLFVPTVAFTTPTRSFTSPSSDPPPINAYMVYRQPHGHSTRLGELRRERFVGF